MSTEADTCRKFVVPKLQAAGWDNDPRSIAEQRSFTDGRIIVRGNKAERKKGKRADYLLRYTRDFPMAVTEAKAEYRKAADGLQQAKDYAEILGLKFAYATNGKEIIEFDFITGIERFVETFPTPDELWSRLRAHEKLTDDSIAARLLTPFNLTAGKIPHYYQEIAIHRVILAILLGQRRVLLTMATGTGKTLVAFFICWILWASRWNRKNDPTRKPRILYLADRNFLVDDPKDKIFSPFGDARHKIEGGIVTLGRELYFATYQSIAKDERRPGLYKEFAPDFFDLIIVDECHRGSAKEDSNWREILEYFAPAYQIGMTATPLRQDNKDTYLYFGNPIYTYSLRQGIDDGFLAPYRVHRIVTQWDATGWRPSKDDLDRYGREIPDEVYTTADFERRVALRARTQAVARHLTDFLKKTDRFAKTIVFCVDQEHASEMRTALNNLNTDLVQQFPDYVCRVTADEGDIGRGHMQRFQDVETRTPVILTTSQLLTTGLDAPTCRNVVLVRLVNSMVEFKQIIGRGTRVRDDYGKLWFNILDYTGTATRNFADPAFDGDPAFATQEEIDEYGKVKETEVITPEEPESVEDTEGKLAENSLSSSIEERVGERSRKYYFDGGQVEIAAELVHELDSDGKQLRVVKLTNPPFGGEEEKGIQGNFPEDKQTAETALLFLQLIMRKLRKSGTGFQPVMSAKETGKMPVPRYARAAVVVPNGTLFGDGVCARIKEELLKEFNLHTIVRLPNGVFAPYTSIPTNILFFDRSGPTREVWYYEHRLPEGRKNYTKTAPIQFEEFADCIKWWDQPGPGTKRKENDRAWKVSAAELQANGCNLDRKNPCAKEDITHLPPAQLAADILEKEQRIAEIMGNIGKLLAKHAS